MVAVAAAVRPTAVALQAGAAFVLRGGSGSSGGRMAKQRRRQRRRRRRRRAVADGGTRFSTCGRAPALALIGAKAVDGAMVAHTHATAITTPLLLVNAIVLFLSQRFDQKAVHFAPAV